MIRSFFRDKLKISRTSVYNSYLFYKLKNRYAKKISKIYKNVLKTSKNSEIQLDTTKHTNRWNILSKKINLFWFKTYSLVSGIEDADYVPEDLFYGLIEPKLNDFSVSLAYADKNFYEKFYKILNIFPDTLIRNINGIFYNSDYEYLPEVQDVEKFFNNENKIIVKPSLESGGGRNVEIFSRKNDSFYYNKNGNKLDIEYLKDNFAKDYLVQKYIYSADYFTALNKTSLNTVRIFTYRSVKTNEIIINNCVLRIGKAGADVDNQASGGIACYIYDDGQLNNYAVDKYGNKYFNVPSNKDLKFSQLDKIPKYDKMKELAKIIAKENHYHRLLGLDFCIDKENNIKLVEINNQEAEINFFQMFGKSLFKEYTDEVIKYCSKCN
jgi:hypothetical protein